MSIEIAKQLKAEIKSGKTKDQAWNSIMVELVKAAKAHVYVILLQSFLEAVKNATDTSIKSVLKKLCDLFALYNVDANASEFIEDHCILYRHTLISTYSPDINSSHLQVIRKQISVLLDHIRPDAVGLVDAFNWSDLQLNSALGRFDGNGN
jgi:acyl-CoA oxidase